MTKNGGFKRLVRGRMAETGETYMQAKAALDRAVAETVAETEPDICGHRCENGDGLPCVLDPGHTGSHQDKNKATWARPRTWVGGVPGDYLK